MHTKKRPAQCTALWWSFNLCQCESGQISYPLSQCGNYCQDDRYMQLWKKGFFKCDCIVPSHNSFGLWNKGSVFIGNCCASLDVFLYIYKKKLTVSPKDTTNVEVVKFAFDDHCGRMQKNTMRRQIAPILLFSDTKSKSGTLNNHYGITLLSPNKTIQMSQNGQNKSKEAVELEEWRPIQEGAGEEGRQEGTLKVLQCLIFK